MGDQEQDQSGNQRIYITGFPPDATEDEVRELFSGIGVIGRVRQKRGYKDQLVYVPIEVGVRGTVEGKQPHHAASSTVPSETADFINASGDINSGPLPSRCTKKLTGS
eukprot:6024327-Pyramimonas_sp.AAC.1